MLVTIDALKSYLGITDTAVAVEVEADAVGAVYDKAVVGDGYQTLAELLGAGYTFVSGGTVILGYLEDFATTGGAPAVESSFTGNVGNATWDSFLLEQEAVVSAAVEGYCGRVFEQTSYVQTLYSDEQLQDYKQDLLLYHFPIVGTPTMVDGDAVTIDADTYRVHSPTAIIKSLEFYWFSSYETVVVTYDAGYATIPTLIQSVVKALVEERYNKKNSGVGLNFGTDVQRISVPGVMSIDFDYSLQTNERTNHYGMILGNYGNVLDSFRAERVLLGTIERAYVS